MFLPAGEAAAESELHRGPEPQDESRREHERLSLEEVNIPRRRGNTTDLMCQDVDVMADVARGRGVLLLFVLALRRRLHLDLTLHVGLFDHLHLRQRQTVGGGAPARDGASAAGGGLIRTSSLGLMLYRILSAFSLSWRLSMIARSSLEALFCREAVEGAQRLTAGMPVPFSVSCFFKSWNTL